MNDRVRTRRRTPRHETQRQLVDAAAKVVAKRGFRGATVDAIADQAGLTSGAVYSNFKTKEDLFLRLYEEKIRNRVTELRTAIDSTDRAEVALDAVIEDETALLSDREWFLLYIEFVLYAARTPSFAKRFAAARKAVLAERADGIRSGLQKWDVDPGAVDVDWIERAGTDLTYGMALHNLIDRRPAASADAAVGLRSLFTGALRSAGQEA
jgi:AcrR family transcriptional regulator